MGTLLRTPRRNYLSRLSDFVGAILLGEAAEQYGAICIRGRGTPNPEILLVTTRETRRWTIPKGWPIKGLKPHQAAKREAWEEGGIKGKVGKEPVGHYSYIKDMGGRKRPAFVEVYVLDVRKQHGRFPERSERDLHWFTPCEAAAHVQEPELKSLLQAFSGFPCTQPHP